MNISDVTVFTPCVIYSYSAAARISNIISFHTKKRIDPDASNCRRFPVEEASENEKEREREGRERKVVSDTGNLVVIVTNYERRGYGRPIYRLCHASKAGKEAPGGACQPHAASLTII